GAEDYGEERQEHDHRDLGLDAEAHPDDQQGGDCDLGYGVEAHQYGREGLVDDPGVADQHAERDRDEDGEPVPDHGLPERHQPVAPEELGVARDRADDLRG